jgi:hypothetical protein
MENDPRNKIIKLPLLGCVGTVSIRQGELHIVTEYHYPPRVEIATHTAGRFNLNDTNEGLFVKLLRIIADCSEYQRAADEVAAQTEARIQ